MNTETDNDQDDPSVTALSDGGFVVTWTSFGQDGANDGVYGKIFASTTTGGHAAGDTLINIEHLTGSAHGDTLIGDAGANRLTGLDGDDTLTGGAGADVFVFAAFDGDTITDFQDGTDRIELRGTAATFADLTITTDGSNTTVTLQDSTLTLAGLTNTSILTVDDFLFIGT